MGRCAHPTEVALLECHGTGTALGDPIEFRALRAVFGPGRATPLALGAVKSSVGHLEGAAAVAGAIKAVLALQRRQAPPNLHLATVNPHLDAEGFPVLFPTQDSPAVQSGNVPPSVILTRARLPGRHIFPNVFGNTPVLHSPTFADVEAEWVAIGSLRVHARAFFACLLGCPGHTFPVQLSPTAAPLTAAVSSFGFGGTNAHLVLATVNEPSPTTPCL